MVKIFCFYWWGEKMWVIPRKRIQNNQGIARFGLPNLATNYLMYWKRDSYFFPDTSSKRGIRTMPSTVWKLSIFRVFLVRILPHSDLIRTDKEYLSLFSPNAQKYGPEKLRIRTLFWRCRDIVQPSFLTSGSFWLWDVD